MRIQVDNKSHKHSRREAIRAKENARTMSFRSDDTPKPRTRRARRALGVACAMLAIALSHVAPCYAWPHTGSVGQRHAHASVGYTAGNAVAAFRVSLGAK